MRFVVAAVLVALAIGVAAIFSGGGDDETTRPPRSTTAGTETTVAASNTSTPVPAQACRDDHNEPRSDHGRDCDIGSTRRRSATVDNFVVPRQQRLLRRPHVASRREGFRDPGRDPEGTGRRPGFLAGDRGPGRRVPEGSVAGEGRHRNRRDRSSSSSSFDNVGRICRLRRCRRLLRASATSRRHRSRGGDRGARAARTGGDGRPRRLLRRSTP